MLFNGSGVALVTPFINDEVNYNMLEKLINFQLDSKTDALIILGTTGENVCLSEEEKKLIIDFTVKKVDGKIPVIAGTGYSCTKKTIELSMYAKEAGIDGLLIVTPYYNKPSQIGLYEHYKNIASSVDLPIILYNVPSRTSVNLEAKTVVDLSKISNIVGVKEASGDLFQVKNIIDNVDDGFYLYSGNDDNTLSILQLGGKGVISVAANLFPLDIHNMVINYFDNNINESKKINNKLQSLFDILFIETNPVIVKAALKLIGYDVGNVRLPLVEINNKSLDALKIVLGEL